jgi:hypothetical protein
MEYLDSLDPESRDPKFIEEMQMRLDALRRYDQNFSDKDWRPRVTDAGWRPNPPFCPTDFSTRNWSE